jgi:hypothetical protein
MPCTLSAAATEPCGLQYNSSRKQQEALLLLLCAAFSHIDGEFSCGNWANILATAKNLGFECISQGANNARQAQIVFDGLGANNTALLCFSDADLAALVTYFTCRLTSELNP